jgi:hypothetical protein
MLREAYSSPLERVPNVSGEITDENTILTARLFNNKLLSDTEDFVSNLDFIKCGKHFHRAFAIKPIIYEFSGHSLNSEPWPEEMTLMKKVVEQLLLLQYNYVLINFYPSHQNAVGYHKDSELGLDRLTPLASVSLGATRIFSLQHKTQLPGLQIEIPMVHGTLLRLDWNTQKHFRHGVLEQQEPCGARYNLTFRNFF